MKDQNKTNNQLIAELNELRERVSEMEQSETEWLQVKNELEDSKAQLAESQLVAKLGSWNLNFAEQKLEWSDETYRLFDKNRVEFTPSFEEFARLVHADDLETMKTNFNKALESNDSPYHVVIRIVNDSRREWVMEAFGVVKRDEENKPLGIFGTAQDVTERVLTHDRLIEAEKKASAASQAKSEFLAHMSHEIRTPLNGIIATADLLLELEEEGDRNRYVQIIKQSGSVLMSILSDVLDFSKIEAGKMLLDFHSFSLKDLLSDISVAFEPELNKQQIALRCQVSTDVPDIIISDPNRLRQILFNLLGNSVKFNQKNGVINLHVSTFDDKNNHVNSGEFICIQFKVEDTGIGIPSEHKERIFESFTQADRSVTRQFGGTGLGLRICKQLCQLMGGDIHLESAEGIGTSVMFRIPVKTGSAIKQSQISLAQSTKMAQETRILLVEDNPINRQVACALLKALGYTINIAENGENAIDSILVNNYDIVLMDCQMPIMDGYEATRRLREEEKFKNLPIIAMTASVTKEERMRCKEVGMNDFIAKPIDMRSVKATLSKWH